MKKLQILIIGLSLLVLATACHHGHQTIIKWSDGNNTTRIEYSGSMAFNTDNSISSMSPRSYLKYKNNDNTLEVKCNNNGDVSYKVNNDVTKTLDEDGKQLLAEAVKAIVKAKTRHI